MSTFESAQASPVQVFLYKSGQHLANEMAHYTCDCWDAELFTSYGWNECVGYVDRSAYDLTVQAKQTGVPLVVKKRLPESHKVARWQAVLDKKKIGPTFKKDARKVQEAVEAFGRGRPGGVGHWSGGESGCCVLYGELGEGKTSVELSNEVLSIKKFTAVEITREYTQNVIEQSFRIARILYALFEHIYWYRHQDAASAVSKPCFPTCAHHDANQPRNSHPNPKRKLRCTNYGPHRHAAAWKISGRLGALGIANNIYSTTASIGKRAVCEER